MNEKSFLENSDIPPSNIRARCPVCLGYIMNGQPYVIKQRVIDDKTIDVIYCNNLCALRDIDNHPKFKHEKE